METNGNKKDDANVCKVRSCAALNCTSIQINKNKNNPRFHSFPKETYLCSLWIINCGRPDLTRKNCLSKRLYYSSYKLCNFHFEDDQFVNNLRTKLKENAVPTIFGDFGLMQAEESLKVLNSLIKQLEDTNAALNQVEKGDFDIHDHIKKEVDKATILSLENVSAEEIITNYAPHTTCKKIINKPTIFTYEEITAEDIRDVDENLIHEHDKSLNNTFKENFSSLIADGDIEYEIYKDSIKSNKEEIKKELEDEDIKIEIIQAENEIQIWNGIYAQDDCYLDILTEKEIKSEDLFVEVVIKRETISDEDDMNCTKLPRNSGDTCGELSILTHQISKRKDLITSESEIGRSFSLIGVRKENDLGKEISNHSSPHCKISHPKNVSSSAQEAANVKTTKSFERTKYYGNHSQSARNNEKDYIVPKVSKRNSDSSETSSNPNKKCLIVTVHNSTVCIKLKPYKRKKKS